VTSVMKAEQREEGGRAAGWVWVGTVHTQLYINLALIGARDATTAVLAQASPSTLVDCC
jgi:hypothetical protein